MLYRYDPGHPIVVRTCVRAGDRVCVRPRHDAFTAVAPGDQGLFPHLAYAPNADYYPNKDMVQQLLAAPGVGTDIRLDMGSTVYLPYAGQLLITGGGPGPEQLYEVTVVDPPETVLPRNRAPEYVWWTDKRSERDWSLTWHAVNTAPAPVTLRSPNAAYAVEVQGTAGATVTPLFGATAGNALPIPDGAAMPGVGIPLVVHLNSATAIRLSAGVIYVRFLLDL